jgi:uridine kinase
VISRPGKHIEYAASRTEADGTVHCSKRAEIPVYSFEKHARLDRTTSIYSPHVLILEGIFALYDRRVLELLDMKVTSAVSCTTLPG